MKNDTRKEITDAFNQLMQQYSFERITIQMIIAQARISKATFYRHFKDKQEVLCSNSDYIFAKSFKNSHSVSDLTYQLLLEYSKLGKKLGQNLLKYTGDNNYTEYINRHSIGFLRELYRRNRNGEEMSEDELFQCRILMSGITNNIAFLSLNRTPEQIRHYTDILIKMLPEEIIAIKW